jgi:hypothetical protein
LTTPLHRDTKIFARQTDFLAPRLLHFLAIKKPDSLPY